MEQVLSLWQEFVIGMGRVLTLVMVTPVLGAHGVPRSIKVVTAVMLTAVCIRFAPDAGAGLLPSAAFAVLLLKEMVVGFLMGLTLLLMITAFQAAGELMGFQMMFSAASAFLPAMQERGSVMGSFVYLFSLLIFVTLNGHHWLISALHQSFRVLPVMEMPRTLGSLGYWSGFFGQWFAISLRLALPVMATLLITNLVLGMVARTMPQLNIFVVGMPLQIMAGLLMLMFVTGSLYSAETGLYREWGRQLAGWVRMISP